MKGYPIKPGVIDPGHDAPEGWHPGPVAECSQCQPAPKPVADLTVEVEVTVTVLSPSPNTGSDCPIGKRQYASRKAALGSYHSLQRRNKKGLGPRPYKCPLCLCWHTGNRRGNESKSRSRK
jgi:hypothetical protein